MSYYYSDYGYDGGGYSEPVYYSAPEPTYYEPVHYEATHSEPVYHEPSYSEPAYYEPAHSEPTYYEPVHDDYAYPEHAQRDDVDYGAIYQDATPDYSTDYEVLYDGTSSYNNDPDEHLYAQDPQYDAAYAPAHEIAEHEYFEATTSRDPGHYVSQPNSHHPGTYSSPSYPEPGSGYCEEMDWRLPEEMSPEELEAQVTAIVTKAHWHYIQTDPVYRSSRLAGYTQEQRMEMGFVDIEDLTPEEQVLVREHRATSQSIFMARPTSVAAPDTPPMSSPPPALSSSPCLEDAPDISAEAPPAVATNNPSSICASCSEITPVEPLNALPEPLAIPPLVYPEPDPPVPPDIFPITPLEPLSSQNRPTQHCHPPFSSRTRGSTITWSRPTGPTRRPKGRIKSVADRHPHSSRSRSPPYHQPPPSRYSRRPKGRIKPSPPPPPPMTVNILQLQNPLSPLRHPSAPDLQGVYTLQDILPAWTRRSKGRIKPVPPSSNQVNALRRIARKAISRSPTAT